MVNKMSFQSTGSEILNHMRMLDKRRQTITDSLEKEKDHVLRSVLCRSKMEERKNMSSQTSSNLGMRRQNTMSHNSTNRDSPATDLNP